MFHILAEVSDDHKYWPEDTYQGDNDFAIGMGLELIGMFQLLAQDSVVVDLAIDRQGEGAILVEKRLGTGV